MNSGIGGAGHLRCDIVEGHRYTDEEPSWYSGPQYARSADTEVSGSHTISTPYDAGTERPSGAFRLPEQRPASPYAVPDSVTAAGGHGYPLETDPPHAYESGRIPVRGPEYPAVRPNAEPSAGPAAPSVAGPESGPAAEPTSPVPTVPTERFEPPRSGEGVYRTRRPVSSFVVATAMAILMIPVVRLLLYATFTADPSAAEIVPAVLLTLGVAMTGIGLFAVAGGGPVGRDAWLRPPVAYLPAGLLLLLATGLAIA